MKQLYEELRVERDKNLKLKEKFKELERSDQVRQYRMIATEEAYRKLKERTQKLEKVVEKREQLY